jgi:phosphoglycolate phosphatase-like HAD superfamily hydrolase
MQNDTLIFDFDGTIADSLTMTIDIFRDLTGWQGARTPEEIAIFRRMPLRKVIKEVKVPLYQVPSLLMRGRKVMTSRITEVAVFPGMAPVIKTLHAEGHRMLVMSSNSTQNVEKFLHHHKLYTYFDGIYGGVGLLNKAASIRRVTRLNNIDRTHCVYIGDEQRDIEGAHRAHIKVIAVSWGYNDPVLLKKHRPTALAETPTDILEIIRK